MRSLQVGSNYCNVINEHASLKHYQTLTDNMIYNTCFFFCICIGIVPLAGCFKCFCGCGAKVTWPKKALLQFPFHLAAPCMSIKLRRWPKWTTCLTFTWCHLISSYCLDRCVPPEIPQISAFRDNDLKKPWLFFPYCYFFQVHKSLLLVDNQTSKSIMSWWGTNWNLSQSNNTFFSHPFFFWIRLWSMKWDLFSPCLTSLFLDRSVLLEKTKVSK